MFKQIRRKDKAMTPEACNSLLLKAEYGVLASTSENGYPYQTPLNYAYLNNKVYFHSALSGEKILNIEGNDKVSFCVVDDVKLLEEKFDTDYKSVIVFGSAYEVKDQEKTDALKAIIEKYSKDFIEEGYKYIERSGLTTRVFAIQTDHISGKYQDSSR